MTRRNVRKQEWVFSLFSPDSDDRLSLNFHRFVILYTSCDTRNVGLRQYCLPKVSNGFNDWNNDVWNHNIRIVSPRTIFIKWKRVSKERLITKILLQPPKAMLITSVLIEQEQCWIENLYLYNISIARFRHGISSADLPCSPFEKWKITLYKSWINNNTGFIAVTLSPKMMEPRLLWSWTGLKSISPLLNLPPPQKKENQPPKPHLQEVPQKQRAWRLTLFSLNSLNLKKSPWTYLKNCTTRKINIT